MFLDATRSTLLQSSLERCVGVDEFLSDLKSNGIINNFTRLVNINISDILSVGTAICDKNNTLGEFMRMIFITIIP